MINDHLFYKYFVCWSVGSVGSVSSVGSVGSFGSFGSFGFVVNSASIGNFFKYWLKVSPSVRIKKDYEAIKLTALCNNFLVER